ncbi:DUF1684 domain-containing protein [Streptomyces massasporeus]|uniref:DUF1684 domain-containing protein n=1 Tax=Streptomyces massasporeus TaxID=67324 RepID=A0ABW6LQH6_9ACTN
MVLTATEADGLTVDGQSFGGEVRIAADPGPASAARVAYGEGRLVVLVREGAWDVRDFDPESSARRAFAGLRVTPCDPSLQVSLQDDGSLWAVSADATSGSGSYGFRFLTPGRAGRRGSYDGRLQPGAAAVVRLRRPLLCAFPSPGNTLDVEVAAGERTLS